MIRIGKKEFTNNIYKYLKPGKVILTSHGKDSLELLIKPLPKDNTRPSEANSTLIRTPSETKGTEKMNTDVDKGVREAVADANDIDATTRQKIGKAKGAASQLQTADKLLLYYRCGCLRGSLEFCQRHARAQ